MQFSFLLAAVVGGEIVDLVGETGPVAKVVLLILLLFSVISWAIILTKWSLLRRARVQSGRFLRAFRKAQRLQDVSAVAEQFKPSPLVAVFEGGFAEHRRHHSAVLMSEHPRGTPDVTLVSGAFRAAGVCFLCGPSA